MTEFYSQDRTWKSAQHLLDSDDLADGANINFNDELFQDYHWDYIYFENIFQDINVSYHLQTLFNWIKTFLI